jgi:hypothetical protein
MYNSNTKNFNFMKIGLAICMKFLEVFKIKII